MSNYEHFLVWVGNIISIFFTGAIFAAAEVGMKVVAFVLAAGAAGTTWRYNYIKIKQVREEEQKRKNNL